MVRRIFTAGRLGVLALCGLLGGFAVDVTLFNSSGNVFCEMRPHSALFRVGQGAFLLMIVSALLAFLGLYFDARKYFALMATLLAFPLLRSAVLRGLCGDI